MNRLEAIEHIELLGGEVKAAVSNKTNVLLVGTNRGETKYHAALKKGVAIIPFPMFVYFGWWEARGGYIGEDDPDIYRDLLFAMTALVDSIYAHQITKPSKRLFQAFLAGAGTVERLLSAAWWPSAEGDSKGRESNPPDPAVIESLRRQGLAGWTALIRFLEMELEDA